MLKTEARICYFVMQTQVNERGEYRALIAVEGERGYHLTDWFWGKDYKIAEQIAEERNKIVEISKLDAFKIVASTMKR